MNINNLIYKIRAALFLLLIMALHSCTNENDIAISGPEIVGNDEGVIMISTRNISDLPEDKLRTLRLFIYSMKDDNEGNATLILNKIFYTANAIEGLPGNDYTYFVKDDVNSQYKISEILKRSNIKVFMVANELTDMSSVSTIDGVRNANLRFFNEYNQGGLLNINIGTYTTGNKGYIPMYAETPILSSSEWNSDGGKRMIELPLKRVLTKVTFHIDDIDLSDISGSERIEMNNISLRVAQAQRLGATSTIAYEGALINTAKQSLGNQSSIDFTPDGKVYTFYVPEYLVSSKNLQDKFYAYIQLDASYYPDNATSPIFSSYILPLAEGAEKYYDAVEAAAPGNIPPIESVLTTTEDLRVLRNKVYDYGVLINSKGTLLATKIEITIKDWDKEQNVDGDITTPSLVLSSIDWKYKSAENELNRIFFWTNKSDISISPQTIVDGNIVSTANVFDGLTGDSPANLYIYQSTDDLVNPYNGYFDLKLLPAYKNATKIQISFIAGKLQRTIKITP